MQSNSSLELLNRSDLIRLVQSGNTSIAVRDERIAALERENAWFRKQLFGRKSEKRLIESSPSGQLALGNVEVPQAPPGPTETVRSYQRRAVKEKPLSDEDTSGLRFDASVPVETILVEDPALRKLVPGKDYEVISEKESFRLAQRPGSYVVLRYVRPVVKLKDADAPSCPAVPPAVIEKSYADVSFLAGLLIDKFLYHLPLYRQHQRIEAAGVKLSRQTLTNLVFRSTELLEPIYYAQLSSILASQVLAMDETPIKAGRSSPGKMHQSYFWPLYGDKDEVAFPYSPTRAHATVREILGSFCGTLLTDGYEAYERFAERQANVVLAQCWSHTRRNFIEAEQYEPALCGKALEYIGELYEVEERIRKKALFGVEKAGYRAQYSKPIVDEFFIWLRKVMVEKVLLSSSPFAQPASYALDREKGLAVFLTDPNVAIDTNHLERALRVVPMGRKNWLFCWTELGAEVVGKIQSLLVTCRLHKVDPYTYLVDVLQRIDSHPAADVDLLTPRLWKENFAANPLPSALNHIKGASG